MSKEGKKMRTIGVWKIVILILVISTLCLRSSADPSLTVHGGGVSLTLNTVNNAGEDPAPMSDSTCSLEWVRDTCVKITVRTALPNPSFILTVEAIDVIGGDSTGEVTITETAQDLITDLTDDGSCHLKYTGSAHAVDGVGTDVHVIIYTITD
jgi:hypothetical protein